MSADTKSVGVLAVIEHDGDRWNVLAKSGTHPEDGFVYCHLASTTKFVQQRNGQRPVQIADWVDPRKMATKLSDRVRPGSEAAPWVIDEIRVMERRAGVIAELIEAARKLHIVTAGIRPDIDANERKTLGAALARVQGGVK